MHDVCETSKKQAMQETATICPAPVTLTFDLLTLKVVIESRVTCDLCQSRTERPVGSSYSTGLSVLDLGPMYVST